MRTPRVILAMAGLLLMSLSGCSGNVNQLELENQALRSYISERRVALEYLEQQAGIAAGCEFIVQMCPHDIVQTGQEALQRGIGGGASFFFWMSFAGKFAVLAVAASVFMGVLQWIHAHIGRPKAAAVREAKQLIAQAAIDAQAAKHAVVVAQELTDRLGSEIEARKKDLDETRQSLQQAREDLEQVSAEVKRLKLVRSALSGFKTGLRND